MKRAYVDSSVWITRFEGLALYREAIDSELKRLAELGWSFVVSEAVAMEVLLKPYRSNDQLLLEVYQEVFSGCGGLLPAYPEIFSEALDVARLEGLKSMDAAHVALALHHQCECVVSADKHFKDLNVLPTVWIELPRVND